jgi:formylglycine-generating enzyme required for sulfatase activity
VKASGSAGVGVAGLALVATVWLALRLAPSGPEGGPATVERSEAPVLVDGTPPPEKQRSGDGGAASKQPVSDVSGFRSDPGALPDDSLLGFVEIPGGPMVMGSDPGVDSLAFDVERWGQGRIQGLVEVPAFYLARYETTVAQYRAFVSASGHPRLDPRALEAPADHPVAWVSWADAVEYAAWLDELLRTSRHTPAALARLLEGGWRVALPTEAQWEKAARGSDGRIYPWGNAPRRDRAHYRARVTAPVGSYACPECPYPVLDLSGNVWEWTRSPYQPYPYDPGDDAGGLDADALWVMRGGGFGDSERMIRAANRGGADPGARRAFIGFRVALIRDE